MEIGIFIIGLVVGWALGYKSAADARALELENKMLRQRMGEGD